MSASKLTVTRRRFAPPRIVDRLYKLGYYVPDLTGTDDYYAWRDIVFQVKPLTEEGNNTLLLMFPRCCYIELSCQQNGYGSALIWSASSTGTPSNATRGRPTKTWTFGRPTRTTWYLGISRTRTDGASTMGTPTAIGKWRSSRRAVAIARVCRG